MSNCVYQVEILDPLLELIRKSDVTAHLAVAVETLREHFVLEGTAVRVEVRHDRAGEFEGIGFYDACTGDLAAHITAYYLDRESAEHVPAEVVSATRSTGPRLAEALHAVFRRQA